ncbi:uncharacterized protein LOC136761871 isoform X2 [Amia ocellicauda]|uniref:uncharacterized protein LOC136761871 isoform X2 n=1 Tax=Amia ocellicauda TaxID=2972642 RepID=UPI00346489F2
MCFAVEMLLLLLLTAQLSSSTSGLEKTNLRIERETQHPIYCHYEFYTVDGLEYCCIGNTSDCCNIVINRSNDSKWRGLEDEPLWLNSTLSLCIKLYYQFCSKAIGRAEDITSTSTSSESGVLVIAVTVAVTLTVLLPVAILLLRPQKRAVGRRAVAEAFQSVCARVSMSRAAAAPHSS